MAEASYEVSDPTIDSQILKIKSAGANLFFGASTPKQAAQAIKKIAELGWHPIHILDINATSLGAVMKPAGLEAFKGVSRRQLHQGSARSDLERRPQHEEVFGIHGEVLSRRRQGFALQHLRLHHDAIADHVLKQCCDELTRENVMKQAANLKNVQLDLTLPGILINTTPTDYRVNKQLQMMKFNGGVGSRSARSSRTSGLRASRIALSERSDFVRSRSRSYVTVSHERTGTVCA